MDPGMPYVGDIAGEKPKRIAPIHAIIIGDFARLNDWPQSSLLAPHRI